MTRVETRLIRGALACASLAFLVSLLAFDDAAGESDQPQEETYTTTQQLWVNSFDAEKGGDYDKALDYTRRILAHGGDFYLPNLRMGWLHYLKQDYEKAIPYYRKAAQLSPGGVSALQGIMNCTQKLGDAKQEKQMAKAILLLDPMNYQANLRLAGLHYEAGDYSVAGSYFRKLLALYPENLQIANGLAWCYLKEGLAREAATLFSNVLAVHPNYLEAKTGLAACAVASSTEGDTTHSKKRITR